MKTLSTQLKKNLIADVENICDLNLTEETKIALTRCFEITIGTQNLTREPKAEPVKEEIKSFRDFVLEEDKKGNTIIMTFEGPARIKLDDLINQPIQGLLYDLNRDLCTILSFIEDPKWVNDFACNKVITELKGRLDELNSK